MAISTYAQLNTALAAAQKLALLKTRTTTVGAWISCWLTGGFPAAGVAPSSGVTGDVPVDSTAGSLGTFVNPASGNTNLGLITAAMSQAGSPFVLGLFDRLWHNSGIDVTLTTVQAINSVALTRPNANGASVEAWLENYTTIGSISGTQSLVYTDQDGNATQTASLSLPTTQTVAGATTKFSLASGDTGIRSIQSFQASASSISGTFGLVLRRCLTQLVSGPTGTLGMYNYDALTLGMPRVYDDACLELLCYSSISNTATISAMLYLAQG